MAAAVFVTCMKEDIVMSWYHILYRI